MFGDGETASQVHTAFYSYKQLEGDNMVDVCLRQVEMMNRVCQFDATQNANRELTLKYQQAGAFKDNVLQREIRQLNVDKPQLSYFDMRDGQQNDCNDKTRINAGQQWYMK